MRENELTELPEELGQLEELTVLDVVGNRYGGGDIHIQYSVCTCTCIYLYAGTFSTSNGLLYMYIHMYMNNHVHTVHYN